MESTYSHFVAASIMFALSLYGVVVNVFIFLAMHGKSKFNNAFYIFCRSKVLSNTIACLAYLLWAVPCTFLGRYYLPPFFNLFWGELAGAFVYLAGLFVNCALAGNRFCATYFPIFFRLSSTKVAYTILILCWFVAFLYFQPGFWIPDCGYYYFIDTLKWNAEENFCSDILGDVISYTVAFFTFSTISFNFLTFIKLRSQMKKIPSDHSVESITKNMGQKLFYQSVTQDCLYLIDMLSCHMLYKLSDAPMFQFFCFNLVWLGIYVLDGTVILLYNRNLLRRKKLSSPIHTIPMNR